jgi:hypothetical protein
LFIRLRTWTGVLQPYIQNVPLRLAILARDVLELEGFYP